MPFGHTSPQREAAGDVSPPSLHLTFLWECKDSLIKAFSTKKDSWQDDCTSMYSFCSVYCVSGSIIKFSGEMNIGETDCLGPNEGQHSRVSPPFCIVLSASGSDIHRCTGVTAGRWSDAWIAFLIPLVSSRGGVIVPGLKRHKWLLFSGHTLQGPDFISATIARNSLGGSQVDLLTHAWPWWLTCALDQRLSPVAEQWLQLQVKTQIHGSPSIDGQRAIVA